MIFLELFIGIYLESGYQLMYKNERQRMLTGLNAERKCEQIVKSLPKGYYCEEF